MDLDLYNKCCDVVQSSRTDPQIESAMTYCLLAMKKILREGDIITATLIWDIHYDWKPGKLFEGYKSPFNSTKEG